MVVNVKPDQLLFQNLFHVDEKVAHIIIDNARCAECPQKPCLTACPAVLFTLDANGQVSNDYAGCLECGTCEMVCPCGGVASWSYPRGGFGIVYRRG